MTRQQLNRKLYDSEKKRLEALPVFKSDEYLCLKPATDELPEDYGIYTPGQNGYLRATERTPFVVGESYPRFAL